MKREIIKYLLSRIVVKTKYKGFRRVYGESKQLSSLMFCYYRTYQHQFFHSSHDSLTKFLPAFINMFMSPKIFP